MAASLLGIFPELSKGEAFGLDASWLFMYNHKKHKTDEWSFVVSGLGAVADGPKLLEEGEIHGA